MKVKKQRNEEFTKACLEFSSKNEYGSINEELLQEECFEMPLEGVHVKHPCWENRYVPAIPNQKLDSRAVQIIGHYATSNAVCAFVYRDGKTYVTKTWEVILALRNAGYKEATNGTIKVPFANGEVIQDHRYAKQWNRITKGNPHSETFIFE